MQNAPLCARLSDSFITHPPTNKDSNNYFNLAFGARRQHVIIITLFGIIKAHTRKYSRSRWISRELTSFGSCVLVRHRRTGGRWPERGAESRPTRPEFVAAVCPRRSHSRVLSTAIWKKKKKRYWSATAIECLLFFYCLSTTVITRATGPRQHLFVKIKHSS